MPYAIDNALFQWEEGERRIREPGDAARADLERAAARVLDELRRRLGSVFTLDELADLYASASDWATSLARDEAAGTDAAWVVDAAFGRYAREAPDYAGGQPRDRPPRA